MKSNLSRWLPVGLWMGIVFGLSSQPSLPKVPGLSAIDWGDKVCHAIAYAVGGALVWRAFYNLPGWRRIAAVLIVIAVYGISDEIHQIYVPPRTFDMLDWSADVVGSALAAIILSLSTGGLKDGTRTGRRKNL